MMYESSNALYLCRKNPVYDLFLHFSAAVFVTDDQIRQGGDILLHSDGK